MEDMTLMCSDAEGNLNRINSDQLHSNRQFHIYQGNGNTDQIKIICERLGVRGVMVSPGGCSNPTKRFDHYAIDNGAFSAYSNGLKWDGMRYKRFLDRHLKRGIPDFIITPDRVAEGIKSLKFSIGWNRWIREQYPHIKQYLAVQDGMRMEDVERHIELFDGLFVGGTVNWKYQTSIAWVSLARKYELPCHIGRIGTKDRIIWAKWIARADSIDSSSWAQSESWHHIEYARVQMVLEAIFDKKIGVR